MTCSSGHDERIDAEEVMRCGRRGTDLVQLVGEHGRLRLRRQSRHVLHEGGGCTERAARLRARRQALQAERRRRAGGEAGLVERLAVTLGVAGRRADSWLSARRN